MMSKYPYQTIREYFELIQKLITFTKIENLEHPHRGRSVTLLKVTERKFMILFDEIKHYLRKNVLVI